MARALRGSDCGACVWRGAGHRNEAAGVTRAGGSSDRPALPVPPLRKRSVAVIADRGASPLRRARDVVQGDIRPAGGKRGSLDRPALPVPRLDKHALSVIGADVGPDRRARRRREARHAAQITVRGSKGRSHRPARAVPVFDERDVAEAACGQVRPHGGARCRRRARHAGQAVGRPASGVGDRLGRPGSAIQTLSEPIISDRGAGRRRRARHAGQAVIRAGRVRARLQLPCGAVPLFHQCLHCSAGDVVTADRSARRR